MAGVLLELVLGHLASLRGVQAYEAVFLLLFLCGIGMPLSQDMLLLAAAGFVTLGTMAAGPLFVVSVLGLLAGDALTFWTGRHWGARWIRRPWAARFVPPERLPGIEESVRRHAVLGSVLTRFLPGQRSTLFFVAGTLRMPWGRFLLGDGIAAMLHVGVLFYGARALGWNWSGLREPFDRADDVLTGLLLVVVLLALWTTGSSKRSSGSK
jgi:membrane protein DedA with SNARE-associated domain